MRCHVRGPDGLIVELAERLDGAPGCMASQCGAVSAGSSSGSGDGVSRVCSTIGIYATEINIHNYHDVKVAIRKHFLPLVAKDEVRGREPRFVRAQAHDAIVLPPNTATMDDSFRITELLYGSPPPQPMPMTIGYLEIVSTRPLAIDAVYTVTDREGRAVAIEVERAEGRPKQTGEGL